VCVEVKKGKFFITTWEMVSVFGDGLAGVPCHLGYLGKELLNDFLIQSFLFFTAVFAQHIQEKLDSDGH